MGATHCKSCQIKEQNKIRCNKCYDLTCQNCIKQSPRGQYCPKCYLAYQNQMTQQKQIDPNHSAHALVGSNYSGKYSSYWGVQGSLNKTYDTGFSFGGSCD